MTDARLALSETLFHETSNRRGNAQVSILVCILSFLALVALLGKREQRLTSEESSISLAAWPSQTVTNPQLHQAALRRPTTKIMSHAQSQQSLKKVEEPVGRRAALVGGMAAATMAIAPKDALAEGKGGGRFNVLDVRDPEVALKEMQELNARNEAERQTRKRLKERTPEEIAAEQEQQAGGIKLAVGGGLALAVPFFAANLQRLGIKVASGGKDDGYGKVPVKGKKRR